MQIKIQIKILFHELITQIQIDKDHLKKVKDDYGVENQDPRNDYNACQIL